MLSVSNFLEGCVSIIARVLAGFNHISKGILILDYF